MARRLWPRFVASFLAVSAAAWGETWQIDPGQTAAHFAVRHLVLATVRGAFAKVSGTVEYDPANPAKTSIDVTIDAASVDSRLEARDDDLRGPGMLDVAKYPALAFRSKRTESVEKGKLKVTGDLTIHGVTKEIVLDVEGPAGPINDPRGVAHMGASATTRINRKDFGVSGFPGLVGDDVAITIDVELVKSAGR